VAKAFNAMQDRIAGLLKARTEALAAVGHDLRTPLARLRLRAGFVKDADAREALEADVDEMTPCSTRCWPIWAARRIPSRGGARIWPPSP
jgi:signal transduction histidine kinase